MVSCASVPRVASASASASARSTVARSASTPKKRMPAWAADRSRIGSRVPCGPPEMRLHQSSDGATDGVVTGGGVGGRGDGGRRVEAGGREGDGAFVVEEHAIGGHGAVAAGGAVERGERAGQLREQTDGSARRERRRRGEAGGEGLADGRFVD